MQQQHFIPASKGLITSTPSSLLPDGAFHEVNNVRFADGYVEKVKGFVKFNSVDGRVIAVNIMKKNDGSKLNVIHTPTGVYNVTNSSTENKNLMTDKGYCVPDVGGVDYINFFDNYIFTSLGNDVYCWDGEASSCTKLGGLYKPSDWLPNAEYAKDTVVKPTDGKYTGYIYKCTLGGTSGTTEPTWLKSGETTLDNNVKWVTCGSLEVEGNSARSVQAKYVCDYKGFVFLANTVEDGNAYPQRLRWSQWQNATLWHNESDGSGLAGYVDCTDTAGTIQAIRKLNDYLFIYKDDGILSLSYTGGEDTTFSKDTVTTEAGLIAPRAIVELPHYHIFVGQDNFYAFDGSSVSAIGDDNKDYFFSKIDPAKVSNIYGYYNRDSGDVLFIYDSTLPHGDSPDKAISYNTRTKQWSLRDINMTALGEFSQTEDRIIDSVNIPIDDSPEMIDSSLYARDKLLSVGGDNEGNIYRLDGYADSRGDYEGYVVTKTHHMNTPEKIKRLMRVMFHIETQGNYNLYVQIGTGWNAETPMTWTKPLYMDLKAPKPPWVDVDLSCRYFAIRFGTTGNSQPFKILGYTIFYQERSDE